MKHAQPPWRIPTITTRVVVRTIVRPILEPDPTDKRHLAVVVPTMITELKSWYGAQEDLEPFAIGVAIILSWNTGILHFRFGHINGYP